MLGLLTCQTEDYGVEIRETARNLLGQELAPPLYPMLLEQLTERVDGFFEKKKGTVHLNAVNSLFTDQAIRLLRTLMESKLDNADDYLALTDMEPLVMGFVDYLRQSGNDDEAQKTKIGFCHLVSTMMARRERLTFRHEMNFRNALVHKVMEFTSTNNQPINHQAELDAACMKATSALLAGLPLQPLYDDDTDQTEAKSKLFLKDFTFFMNVTNRSNKKTHVQRDSTGATADFVAPLPTSTSHPKLSTESK